jgi:cell division protein FtsW (lipid II flippase)
MLTFNFLKKQKPRTRSYYSTRDDKSDEIEPSSPFRRHKPDYLIILISVALLITGLIVVYSISPALAAGQEVGGSYYVGKQITSILLGLAAFVSFSALPLKVFRRNA